MHHFDGDVAIMSEIARQEYRRHGSATQLALDAIAVGQPLGDA
jgi:hypothetical protein